MHFTKVRLSRKSCWWFLELTILGFVSFILFLAQTFNLVRWVSYLHLDEDITEAKISYLVRIIHMCLFVTMLFYIVLVIFLYILTNHTREYWTTAESKKFVNVERDFEQIRLNKKEGFRSLLQPITLYRYQKLYDLRTYHLLRRVFVQRNYLRKSFCFDVYLKRSSRKTLINLVTIHWIVWFALLAYVAMVTMKILIKFLDLSWEISCKWKLLMEVQPLLLV